jgi:hypothetical protein
MDWLSSGLVTPVDLAPVAARARLVATWSLGTGVVGPNAGGSHAHHAKTL